MNFSGIEVDRPSPAPWERNGEGPPPPPKPADLAERTGNVAETEEERRRRWEAYMEELEARPPTLEEIMYAVNSFAAVMWPVALTMVFAAVLVVVVDDGTNGDGAGGSGTLPTPYIATDGDSAGEEFVKSILNALAIIGIMVASTFGMVFLYYFKLFKVMVAYLMIAAFFLLNFTTALVATTAYQVFRVPMDAITHYAFFANFAACGVIAIFYQKGIPRIVNQMYIITISVTMAWLLLRLLPEWTSWALLVFLACYDLCAVLTPCGPLKCLVEMAQDNEDSLPGLLYEADVRDNPQAAAMVIEMQNNAQQTTSQRQISQADSASTSSMNDPTPPGSVRGNSSSHMSNQRTNTRESAPRSSPPRSNEDIDVENAYLFDSELPPPPPTGEPVTEHRRASIVHLQDGHEIMDRSIKLGLGDFVFYSVLVGRAALFSFPTFVAVLVTVLFGLAATLILLSVFKKALPALPISIFVGVIFYFLTELAVTPFSNYLIIRTMFV